jgi:hypothetical protein
MNPIAARMDFEQAVRIMNHAFNPKNDPTVDVVSLFRITQSSLRLEQPLVTTNGVLTFPVLNNIANQPTGVYNTEIRLAQQDSFIPTRIGIFFGLPSSGTDTSFKLYPYPSPYVFTNGPAMEALYAGTLNILVQNDKLVKNWSISRHRKVNQTQETAAYGVGSPLDQMDGDEDGYIPMQPFVLMIGSQDINISINMPVAPSAVDANTRVIMIMNGVIATNSTPVN